MIHVNKRLRGADKVNPSSKRKEKQEASIMLIDEVVLAGIVTVGLMVLFFGGVGYFIWKDSHKRG